jgi:capsid portal protein
VGSKAAFLEFTKKSREEVTSKVLHLLPPAFQGFASGAKSIGMKKATQMAQYLQLGAHLLYQKVNGSTLSIAPCIFRDGL